MSNRSGQAEEEYVANWLQEKGYTIVARNYHSRFGEIDIIARREPYIAFVEVKARERNSLVSPFEAITSQKMKKIVATAKIYLQRNPSQLQPRFDAAAVHLRDGRIDGLEYLENVFIS